MIGIAIAIILIRWLIFSLPEAVAAKSGAHARPTSVKRSKRWLLLSVGAGVLIVTALGVGAFPVNFVRPQLEHWLTAMLDRPVKIGAIRRAPWFSFTPTIYVENVSVAQPAWVGGGDFATLRAARFQMSVWDTLRGKLEPEALLLDGLTVALIRTADKRNNWADDSDKQDSAKARSDTSGLRSLTIVNSQFSLRDAGRQLNISGPLSADSDRGVRLTAKGQYRSQPIAMSFAGAAITGREPASAYPFTLKMDSPVITLSARGSMEGTLNTRKFSAQMNAQAPDLFFIDKMIEAGLFKSQPVNLTANVRHDAKDWYIDRLSGSVGRSRLSGRVDVLKREGRSKIDGNVRFATLDFSDFSSDEGRARAAAKAAQIGPRVVPETRINLTKIGPTDGKIDIVADQLLFAKPSVFRSLQGTLSLDHRVVMFDKALVRLNAGMLGGAVKIDHRSGRPKLHVDLSFSGATLGSIIGQPQKIEAAVRGRIKLIGTGDSVREAIANANGKAAMVASRGRINKTIAAVLGQDLGNAIGAQLKNKDAAVPLRCLVASFRARNGVLVPSPLAIETEASSGRGVGHIVMNGEAIALTIAGAAKDPSGLKIVDPIRIGGTLSQPTISVAGLSGPKKPKARTIFKLFKRSIGAALGLVKPDPKLPVVVPSTLNCEASLRAALAG